MTAKGKSGMSISKELATRLGRIASVAMASISLATIASAQTPQQVQVCSGSLEYEQLTFDFSAPWMKEYSFWIDKSVGFRASIPHTGAIFFDINGVRQKNPTTVRVMTSQGHCLLQFPIRTFDAEPLRSFVDRRSVENPETDFAKMADTLMDRSVTDEEYERFILVNFGTEENPVRVRSRSALLLDGRVVYVD